MTTTSQTGYGNPWFGDPAASFATSTEATMLVKATDACTLSNLIVEAYKSGSVSPVARSRNNSANGNQSVTITATSAGTAFEDTTNSDSVTAANSWAIQFNQSGTVGDVTNPLSHGMHMSYSGSTIITGTGGGNSSPTSSTRFTAAYGGNSGLTESQATLNTSYNETFTRFRVGCLVYSSSSSVQVVRKNIANGNGTVTVSSASIFEDVTNSDACTTTTPDAYGCNLVNGSSMNTMRWSYRSWRGNQTYMPFSGCGGTMTTGVFAGGGLFGTNHNLAAAVRAAASMTRLQAIFITVGGGGTDTLKVNKNGSNGNQSLAASATNTRFTDTTNTDTFSSGDTYAESCTTSSNLSANCIQQIWDTAVAATKAPAPQLSNSYRPQFYRPKRRYI
jgi:hypothetical protein